MTMATCPAVLSTAFPGPFAFLCKGLVIYIPYEYTSHVGYSYNVLDEKSAKVQLYPPKKPTNCPTGSWGLSLKGIPCKALTHSQYCRCQPHISQFRSPVLPETTRIVRRQKRASRTVFCQVAHPRKYFMDISADYVLRNPPRY